MADRRDGQAPFRAIAAVQRPAAPTARCVMRRRGGAAHSYVVRQSALMATPERITLLKYVRPRPEDNGSAESAS